MRRPAAWEIAIIVFVGAPIISGLLAWQHKWSYSPVLGVVAAHILPANHKLGPGDLQFAVMEAAPLDPDNLLESPEEVLGGCTRNEVTREKPVRWEALVPPGTGEGTCASSEAALKTLELVIGMPNEVDKSTASSPTASTAPLLPAVVAARLASALTASDSTFDDAAKSALGEFRGEFIKEFAKRLADNAGDRVFQRGRAAEEKSKVLPPPPLPHHDPSATRVRAPNVVYFNINQVTLRPDQHEELAKFASALPPEAECHLLINAFTDRTGTQRDNLWLSWERGNEVAEVLTKSGIARRRITIIPHGYENPSVDAASWRPSDLDRRVETAATCQSDAAVRFESAPSKN